MLIRLQKELFIGDEHLLAMCHCFKITKEKKSQTKRKEIYLCILNTQESNTQQPVGHFNISICEVVSKSSNSAASESSSANDKRNVGLPKRKRSWPLRDLRSIDAQFKSSTDSDDKEDIADFILGFHGEKELTWTSVNFEDKKRFLSTLVSLATKSSRTGTKNLVNLLNLPPDVAAAAEGDGNKQSASETGDSRSDKWPLGKDGNEIGVGKQENVGYQAISDKEEKDVLGLMKTCDYAVTNADLFVDDLQRQLNILDGANIHSIMASEESVEKLMGMLCQAIQHVETLETRLDQYDNQLEHIRDSMDKMNGGDFETVNINNKRLLDKLEYIVEQLDLPYQYQQALTEAPADFNQPHKLREAIEAANVLERALTVDIDPSLMKLQAVQDQRKLCEKFRNRFSKAVSRHLTNLIVHVGNDTDNLEASHNPAVELKLSRRRSIHKELVRYAELVHWLKSMDPSNFSQLQSTYRTSMCKLYEKDLRRFFESAKFRVSGGKSPGGFGSQMIVGSSADLTGGKKKSSMAGGGGALLGNDTDSLGSELSLSERERFDDILETILIELETVCMDEQNFSIKFFKMNRVSDVRCPDPKRDKLAMEAARSMMAEIFPSLEHELGMFISTYEKADSFFTLHALVRLSKHVLSTQDTGSFLAISLGTVLVNIKRNFDKFMQMQLRSIEEARAPSRTKCGILPFIANFERFVTTTEAIFRSSERRVDLEKWYGLLVAAMITAIARISFQHARTPADCIKMENYHHLYALLSRWHSKIKPLESLRNESKAKYQEALKAYVTKYFGRPLEKLNVFFDGVQALVAAGVKESEVGYQLAYSKQELRKVILLYPGKEVRKGLERLYKKVEKHLCEEEGLVQVVWRAMQEEFIQQYKCIEDLIQRCYPGAQISLDFDMQSIHEYFSVN